MTALRLVSENSGRDAAESYTPIVSVYADASCLRKGSPNAAAGCGAVIIDRNRMEIKLVAKYLGSVTNQQAEILACAKALEELRRPCRIEVFSDSRYVIDTMTGRSQMKMNWPFWSRLIGLTYRHHITWRWIKGRGGMIFQEAADRLGRAAASVQTDLLSHDLDFLCKHLSDGNNQLSIRSFETELEKIASRYHASGDAALSVPKLDGIATYPSAFSS